MRVYRMVWCMVCGALAVFGISVAFLFSPTGLATLFVTFGVLGAIMGLAVDEAYGTQPDEYGPQHLGHRLRLLVVSALAGGVTGSWFVGYTVLLGAGVLMLSAIVLVSSPRVLNGYLHWLANPTRSASRRDRVLRALAYAVPEFIAPPPPSTAPSATTPPIVTPVRRRPESGPASCSPPTPARPPGDPAPLVITAVSDEDLCRLWRASFPSVRKATDPQEMMWATGERQLYLDELERRNGAAFHAWLASSPRAAGNPLPYLRGERPLARTINWEELIAEPGTN
jgi:hypothetical protein